MNFVFNISIVILQTIIMLILVYSVCELLIMAFNISSSSLLYRLNRIVKDTVNPVVRLLAKVLPGKYKTFAPLLTAISCALLINIISMIWRVL